jgi:hypothetical protein
MVLAGVVLLVAYVASYLAVNWYDGYRGLEQPVTGIVKVAYLPLDIYRGTGLPGSEWLALESVVWYMKGQAERSAEYSRQHQ